MPSKSKTAKATSKAKAGTGDKQAKPGSGKGGIVPPIEHRWKAGAPSPNPNGRPRNLSELRKLVQEMGNEEITQAGMTRLQLLLRTMYSSKSASDKQNVLEYGFGKVPQVTQERTYEDDVIELLEAGQITEEQVRIELPTDAERLIATARLRRIESGPVEKAGGEE